MSMCELCCLITEKHDLYFSFILWKNWLILYILYLLLSKTKCTYTLCCREQDVHVHYVLDFHCKHWLQLSPYNCNFKNFENFSVTGWILQWIVQSIPMPLNLKIVREFRASTWLPIQYIALHDSTNFWLNIASVKIFCSVLRQRKINFFNLHWDNAVN
jgi:hypothetical protein